MVYLMKLLNKILFIQSMKKNLNIFIKWIYHKVLNHKIITGILIIGIVSFSYYYFFKRTSTLVTYQYATVKRGTISSVVSATGQVTPDSQVDLKPKVNANVTAVYVKAGDRVKTGQVLFRLDATDAYKQVRDAKTSLASAEIALKKLKNPTSAELMSANDLIKQEEEEKSTNDQKVQIARNTLLNTSLQAIPDVSFTTETAPTLSGNYLKGDEGQIKIVVYQGGPTGYSFSATGLVTSSGQVNTSVAQPIGDSGLYIKWEEGDPKTNWIINIPNKQSSSYLSNYNALQNAITNRDIANAASDRTIASLKQKLADLTPGDDNLDVQSSMIQVEQRKNALLDAQQGLSNYTITAPFDGVMASVSGAIGVSAVVASSNSSTALGTIVTDKKMAQVTLNEADVVKVRLNQKANVTFDAIEGLSVEGTVVEINTLGSVTSGVVTYKVKVAFNADDSRILPNMSAVVDILTDSKDNILYVPSQAVKHDTSGYYVEEDTSEEGNLGASSTRRWENASSTFNDQFASGTASSTRTRAGAQIRTTTASTPGGTLRRIPVIIGIQSDTQTEIVSGLREGERVITKKITTTGKASTAAPSITSLFRPQGAGQSRGGTTSPGVVPRNQ